jgi:catechol 2,3-dioxygenase-like lactoylglutathione lyase family enzyme
MRIQFCSILVDDQEKALSFYTNILGFKKKADFLMGTYRFLTVTSPENPDDLELILEPTDFEPSKTYQKSLYEAGKPSIALITKDIQGDYSRLKKMGVVFRNEPQNSGPIISVLFEDTCGNIINLIQQIQM